MSPRKEIPYVDPPSDWTWSHAVKQLPETRWWIEEGYGGTGFRQWLVEIHEAMAKQKAGIVVPLQWVPELIGVTRAAVHRRAKSGGLTVFTYVIVKPGKTVLGFKVKEDTRKRYDLVPLREIEAWRDILWDIRGEAEEFGVVPPYPPEEDSEDLPEAKDAFSEGEEE